MNKISNGDGLYSVVTTRSITGKTFYILSVLLILLSITTIVLTAITVSVLINRLSTTDSLNNDGLLSYAELIKIDDLMGHLEQLQVIADQSNGTRAIGTQGFNSTLDYITNQLEKNTDFIIRHEYFTLQNSVVRGIPQLQSRIDELVDDYVYLTDFTHIVFSSRANFDSFIQLVSIPNLGCNDSDWINVLAEDSIALVKRGNCTFVEKVQLAEKYRVKGLLIYNDGLAPDRFQPLQNVRTQMNTTIPAYFLSYNLGIRLATATTNVGIIMKVDVSDAGVGNICADTPSGDRTKTIVVGSHSDGVLDGSGINDNGSGTVGTLVLALNLARLLKSSVSTYAKYQYRVRFCWWGAEEIGLLGSTYHVEQASLPTATIESGRLQDYLLYFNYDMLASPNNNFGILDSLAIPPGTPEQALSGTNRISYLFQQWFDEQKLPWTRSGIGGGSDFVPFLVGGVASGGVNTGAGGIKSADERDQYATISGINNGGGAANVAYDPCYHQQCDRITNVNPFAYETVVKAAAYAIEYVERLNDLEKWLYPQGRANDVQLINRNQQYDIYPINTF